MGIWARAGRAWISIRLPRRRHRLRMELWGTDPLRQTGLPATVRLRRITRRGIALRHRMAGSIRRMTGVPDIALRRHEIDAAYLLVGLAMEQGSIKRAFTYLESGAVLLVTTNDGARDNVMTISWQMVLDFTPRIAIATGPWNNSFQTILKTKECCLCVPAFDMVEQVVQIGMAHGAECDKFERFTLPKEKAKKVRAPLISDCLAALECKLEDYVDNHVLLVFKGVQLWENAGKEERRVIHANGDGTFFADGEFRNLRREMREKLPEGCERF